MTLVSELSPLWLAFLAPFLAFWIGLLAYLVSSRVRDFCQHALESLSVKDPEWNYADTVSTVRDIHGNLIGGEVMVRWINGRPQYRLPTEEEEAERLAARQW